MIKIIAISALAMSLFVSSYGQNPDDVLKSRIPEAAECLLFLNGDQVCRTAVYQEFRPGILGFLNEESLKEKYLSGRHLFYFNLKEGWGGAVLQYQQGQGAELFQWFNTNGKNFLQNMKNGTVNNLPQITGQFQNGKQSFIAVTIILFDKNLLLIAAGKTDLKLFQPMRYSQLSRHIRLDTMLSAAIKFNDLREGVLKQEFAGIMQISPAMINLEQITINIPSRSSNMQVVLQGKFKNEHSAQEVQTAINMILAELSKTTPELDKMIGRKAEKNSLIVSYPFTELENGLRAGIMSAQIKAKRISSAANLKMIALACKMYSGDFNEKFPDDLNTLAKGDYSLEAKNFISPLDLVRKPTQDKVIRPQNTSYAYVAKGLTENDNPNLPVAFEKPDLIGKDGYCAVTYVDGSVRPATVKGRTCKAIAEELTAKYAQSDAKAVALILQNAEAEDQAK